MAMSFVSVRHRSPAEGSQGEGRLMDIGIAHIVSVASEPTGESGLFEVRLSNTTVYVDAADRYKILDTLA